MKSIEVYTKDKCPYCERAKALLKANGQEYKAIDVTHNESALRQMIERSSNRTVPQIFIDGLSIGGYTELAHLYSSSKAQ